MLIEQCCRCVVESVIGVTVLMLSESRRKHQPNFLLHVAGRLRTDLIQMSAASANRLAERNSTAYILRIFTNHGTLTKRLIIVARQTSTSAIILPVCEDGPAQYVRTSSRTRRVCDGEIITAAHRSGTHSTIAKTSRLTQRKGARSPY
jgi:hypothetical protein